MESAAGKSVLWLWCLVGVLKEGWWWLDRHSSCVRYLVHCGADPLLKEASRGQTCLHLAAEGSHNNCIVKLLTSGEVNREKLLCVIGSRTRDVLLDAGIGNEMVGG